MVISWSKYHTFPGIFSMHEQGRGALLQIMNGFSGGDFGCGESQQ
jgi:hypothetical protein